MIQIKKTILTLVALIALTTGAWAQSPWTSGDCTVTLSGDVMTVSGTGAMADYKDSYELPWYGYDIKTIVIESGVSSIGNSAFAKCYNLESVSIPASVTSIGMQAFENCGYDATALTVSFAEGSTPLTIGEYAFYYANLKSIDIPNRVTSIGNGAFTSCSKLESVSIPASVTSIGNFAFQSCGSYAEALTVSFAEGSTLESIGESTFLEAKLTSINIPNSVTSIGTFAFSGCSNLESVSIPASVTSIGYNAFSSCSKLESVSIPASVTSISEGAFRYCGMLAKVYIYAPSLTTYGANAFTSNAAGRKIYVLSDAVDTYKAGWPDYAADIVGDLQPLASGPEVAWNAATKTGTFTMPGDNVTVSVEYYDLATLADKGLSAAEDAAAKTEAPLAVLAENAITGGTVMYYVAPDANFSQADAIALAQTAWSADIPTAETIDAAGGTCYVWYYIKGDDEHSDTDPQLLQVTVLPEPTYTVEFAEGTEESDKWTVKAGTDGSFQSLPLKGVKAGTKVKLKYDGDRSMLKGVTAVKKAAAAAKTLAEATSEDLGKVVGADGKIYATKADAEAVATGNAVAMICYVNEDHGLALALSDEGDMDWSTALTTCAAHTPAVTGARWKLASKSEMSLMINAAGNYAALRDGFSAVGGTNLIDEYYWLSDESSADYAEHFNFGYGSWSQEFKSDSYKVRACLEW